MDLTKSSTWVGAQIFLGYSVQHIAKKSHGAKWQISRKKFITMTVLYYQWPTAGGICHLRAEQEGVQYENAGGSVTLHATLSQLLSSATPAALETRSLCLSEQQRPQLQCE